MEYMGARDYWFWLGVDCGFYRANPEEYLEGRLAIPNEVSTDCSAAFKDGFVIGCLLTAQDYIDLTVKVKPDTIPEVDEAEKEIEEIVNVPITGRC